MQRGRLIVERNACIVQRERRDKLCGGIVHLAQEQELTPTEHHWWHGPRALRL